jgi:succinate dehydrogenase/fumarate reductase flavoprotein subunit
VIVGGGGAGLRAAIAVAESDPALKIALVSKVYPMRSHTVAAEGGSAGVKLPTDSLDYHFNDTVGGGDWLVRAGCGRVLRGALQRGIDPARALGLPVEPYAGRARQCARLRRHEDRAHLVRRRQDRFPHAAHAVPDLDQVSVDQAFRRTFLRRSGGRGRSCPGRRRDRDRFR